jgi:hypothetical protein
MGLEWRKIKKGRHGRIVSDRHGHPLVLEDVIQLINVYQIDFNYTKQWDKQIAAVNKRCRLEFPRPLQNIKDNRLENELVIGRQSYLPIIGRYIPDCSELRLYNPSYWRVSNIRYEKLRFSSHFLCEMLKFHSWILMKQIFLCLSIERDRDVLDHKRMSSLGWAWPGVNKFVTSITKWSIWV